MIKKLLPLVLLACFINFSAWAQRSNCDNNAAGQITVTTNCTTPTAMNSANGTDYWDSAADPGCAATDLDDVWAWFVALGTSTTITYTPTDALFDPVLNIFDYNTCLTIQGSGAFLACENSAGAGAPETVTIVTVPGTRYRIRVQDATTDNNYNGTICVVNNVAAIAGDDPCIAQPLTVGATCTYATYTNAGATTTNPTGIPTPGCGNYSGGDVWFTVTVPASGSLVIDTQSGVITDSGMAIYSAASCSGPFTLIECDDDDGTGLMSNITRTGLTPGSTIYIRVWEFGNDNNGTFGICVTEPVDPCSSVTNIASCGTNVNVNIPAGTGTFSQTACWFLGTPGIEQIYTFTPAVSGNYTIQQNSSTGFIDYFFKLAGTCSGTGWTCIEDLFGADTSVPFSLIAGNTYYIMLDPEGTGADTVNFNIACPPPVPPNDLCGGAVTLDCNGPTLSGTTNGAISAASGTGCTVSNYGVWYTFVGDGQQTTITSTAAAGFDHEMDIMSGTCGLPLTNIACVDGFVGGSETYTFITVPLTTYYVYIAHWDAGSTTTGNFTISRTCIPTTPPPNDLCLGATLLNCGDSVAGNTSFATNTNPVVPCATVSNIGVWYTFVGTGGQMIVTVVPDGTYNPRLSVMTGSCGSFTIVPGGCYNSGGNGVVESFSFNSVLGTNYTVYVAQNGAASTVRGSFTISLSCCNPTVDTTPSCGVVAGGLGLNGSDPAPINCSTGGCVDLEAEYLKMGNTTSYRVEQIPYNPPPNGALLPVTGLQDDYWSSRINFPGSWTNGFCFYGVSYTQFLFGANGMVTFDVSQDDDYTGYIFNNNIPSGAAGLFNNTIYGVYQDIDPSVGGTIGRSVDNTPGCERMIIVWDNVPMYYSGSFSGSGTKFYSGKMVLYKNTNIIEIYIQQKVIDDGAPWNNGNAIVGLQNTSTDGIAAPCRNGLDPDWTVTNEAWRFVPDAGDISSIEWWADTGSGFVHEVAYDGMDTPNVCPSVTTTYEARVTYTPACGSPWTITDQTVVTVGDKVWNGSVNTDWFVANNWTPSGVPLITDCVTIPPTDGTTVFTQPLADVLNAPAAPNDVALARNVKVLNNAFLEVATNTFLEIDEWLNVQPSGDVLLRNNASLVQLTNPASNNNTGSIRVQRTASGVGAQNYVYWSSPTEGFDVGSINTAASELRWEWNPTQSGLNGTWIPASGPMTVGKGYIVRGLAPAQAGTVEFAGVPSNGTITVPITCGTWLAGMGTYTAAGGNPLFPASELDDNWNLVGNPYPSAISADDFLLMNAAEFDIVNPPSMYGTIYLWDRGGTPGSTTDPFYGDYASNYVIANYVSYNSTGAAPPGAFNGNIASGQSFFIQMDDNSGARTSGSVTFDNTMRSRSYANNQFLRTIERHRVWLDLIDPASATVSAALIGYVQGATNDLDRLFDGDNLSDSHSKLYSIVGERELCIQGRALPMDQEDRVPLGITISQNGSYKIAINAVDGLFSDNTQNIYLEDRYLNTIYDLRVNPYTFTSAIGTFNDRFILRYTNATLSTPDEIANFGFNIIGLKDYIKVTSSNSPISTVIVYDVLGRVLADYKKINALEFKLDLLNQSKGALIVKATLENGQQKIKKVIY